MNRLFLVVGVGIAIVALMFLNQGIKKASPTDEDLQKQAQEEAQKSAPVQKPESSVTSAATSAVLPEETVGNPATAKHHIQVGWVYNETMQADPQALNRWLSQVRAYVQKSRGMASAEIVDVDVPVEDRSPAARAVTDLGITVDGKPVMTGDLSDKLLAAQQITQMLATAAK